ncbi:MAG: SPOR domain-containing protein [Lewinellaceae bacterium]|nr:SPOR domain-containing protein [Lewinellaceae bacterium]
MCKKIQFLPDSINFSSDHYGLQPLQFSPISRAREVNTTAPLEPQAAVPGSQPVAPPPPVPDPVTYVKPTDNSRWLPLIGLAVVLVMVVLGFMYLGPKKNKTASATPAPTETPSAESSEPSISKAPEKKEDTSHDEASLSISDAPKTTINEAPKTTASEPKTSPTPKTKPIINATPKPAPATTGKECIIVIGVFQDKDNVRQLKEKLSAAQYNVYQTAAKNGTQIGVRFNYTNVAEIQKNLNELQSITGVKELWIKKK